MHDSNWQAALQDAITDPQELWNELKLNPTEIPQWAETTRHFALRVPRSFVHRMKKGNPKDPLLLQVLPMPQELTTVPGYGHDPLNEKHCNPVPGLLHKYHGRALVTLSGACAIHCRYCFRRDFPYEENTVGKRGWQSIVDYLKAHDSITEIILSGGDPLIVKDERLAEFISEIEKIPSLKRLRIHTRLPIVIPERVTDCLVNLLSQTRLSSSIVLHCNHAQEIDATVIKSLHPLRESKIILLNQSVLLKNINDTADALITLSERLFESGVLPYYLHLLDPVHGTAHFDVSEAKAKILLAEMTRQLPGYLVPKLVREIPGAPAKKVVPVTV